MRTSEMPGSSEHQSSSRGSLSKAQSVEPSHGAGHRWDAPTKLGDGGLPLDLWISLDELLLPELEPWLLDNCCVTSFGRLHLDVGDGVHTWLRGHHMDVAIVQIEVAGLVEWCP